jgi:hypothetical protein
LGLRASTPLSLQGGPDEQRAQDLQLDAGTPSVRALEEAIEMDLTPDQIAAIKKWIVTSGQRLEAVSRSHGA